MTKQCAVDECDREVYARAYCAMHYQRLRKHGSTSLLRKTAPDPCKVDGCERRTSKGSAKGYCTMHYLRVYRTGEPGDAEPLRKPTPSNCNVEGCPRDPREGGFGYCRLHYIRVRRVGDAGPVEQITGHGLTIRERILRLVYVNAETGCWEYTGSNTRGYGRIALEETSISTHRWVYEQTYGPIPEGMVLDHLCVNPPCCFPDHLEVVTRAENSRRGGWTTGARRLVKP